MMKNVSVKILAGVGALSLAAAVYSFASNEEPKDEEQKKYEVIRMVDGEMMQFDTIVNASSGYTPQDYLNDLGFGDDENVSIIDLSSFDHNEFVEMHHGQDGEEHDHEGKMVFIEIDEEGDIKDGEEHEIRIEKKIIMDGEGNEFTPKDGEVEMIIIDENGNTVKNDGNHEIRIEKKMINEDGEEVEIDGEHEIRIEKKIIINEDGEEEIEVDVDAILEDLNLDSLIQMAIEMEGMEGDSHKVIMHKMIISDEDGENDFEWEGMDTEGADFHKEVHGPGHHMEIAMWGEDHEDFTLVIVSDPNESPSRTASTDEESTITDVKLYPNPATTTSQLQLNFEDKANTSVTITDILGKAVAKLDLGKFKGQFTHDIDVEKWEKGVYLVRITHGDEEVIEKLIVQ